MNYKTECIKTDSESSSKLIKKTDNVTPVIIVRKSIQHNSNTHVVVRVLDQYKETNSHGRVKNPGRTLDLKERVFREIFYDIKRDPLQPMSAIRKAAANPTSTIKFRMFLHSKGIYSRRLIKKPKITEANMKKKNAWN
ncbi:hypothetical protein PHYBLDRAFT_70864 [Phycomyces blakesleeanus NRRL 1555(-)]|uniref:Homeodomain-like DNA binding domain-containing transcription factor n=1 Tax=Phycomyces blakesleeanus (strain ATCC 8743b / DSM 1359 / FGSC 10004 / NBRC 33097 / NRRL 1555) TaxID=763407 RepID=A0A162TE38_PHYB8|nr:hypothetical protein PHYBLDRAFT_70864 [Phycomyces blakesleeanus NRRL 1555(-)]OAD66403.1 hypothetical protein PHYBLDRAFT_70864 [Phycomyces blakesleeanus NRRL 1555(-)]|eukprot:XP_018284443.1 hypothetical protein PHYBLDRAFT_70864 [Phycomyces blakesleeanus NRRL 1555(-)]